MTCCEAVAFATWEGGKQLLSLLPGFGRLSSLTSQKFGRLQLGLKTGLSAELLDQVGAKAEKTQHGDSQ